MEQNTQTMDGILYLTDESNERRFLQIDLTKFDAEYIEDLLDGLMAEAVKDEESVSLEDAIKELKAAGKLDE
jgi:transcriptional regulator of NAD metabolism